MTYGSIIRAAVRQAPESIEVIDPATEEVLDTVACASVEDCLEAVDAASAAFPAWASTSPRERGEILRGAFERKRDRRDELARLIADENGKTLRDALGEVDYAAEFFRWFSEEAVRIGGELRPAPGRDKQIATMRQPIGVALLITPWNFPAAMATRKLAPALAAGCCTVLKPASATPLTAFAVAEILAEAGLPDAVVNVVCPSPPGPAVAAMMAHPKLRTVSFTGSTEVGSQLLEQAARGVLRCSMELGGNAPFIVYGDANVDAAIEGALVAKMRNGGASCIAANRFYVDRSIAPEFTEGLTQAMAGLAPIDPGDDGPGLGPLVSRAERDRVSALVSEAVSDGARPLTGGAPLDRAGYFYAPTVLVDVDPEAPILSEEIFGPVATVVAFDREEEALAMANATDLGLAAYAFTRDLAKGMRAAQALEAGIVGLNRGFVSDPAAPFGGVKRSGLGREGGREGIDEFLETKYVAMSWD
ncbi:MAG: NAD-dependent succinate-semialdehyde dehydrogenase [Solirubrobacteraceae bacterium]